jgi:hypothetical protein
MMKMVARHSRAVFSAAVLLPLGMLPAATADEFESDWRRDPDRIWVGSAYHANRWQDWRVNGGRLECTEATKRLAMRTVQVLSSVLDPELGQIEMRVRLGVIDHDAQVAENAWGGLSIGAGGKDIDYRRTAMVHHIPAADGGVVVVVDGHCNVEIRDNEQSLGKTALWSIARDVTADELPVLAGTETRSAPVGRRIGRDGVELRVRITPDAKGYTIRATVLDAEAVETLSSATVSGVALSKVEGGFGLVSHHGPQKSTLGWWFAGLHASGPGVVHVSGREFGPILGTLYTVDDGVMKMTAQFPPLGEEDQWSATLQIQPEPRNYWETVASAPIDKDSRTATFRVEDWQIDREIPYRVIHALERTDGSRVGAEYHGIIRAEPPPEEPLLLGALTCHKTYTGGLAWNDQGLWLPHEELVQAVQERDPDLLYFSGDQIYEGDLTPASQRNEDALILDYLWKYSHWIWAFRDITRDRPTVVIPDDHDVYHGNIWGAGGRRGQQREGMTVQDSGGYKHAPRFVNAVHRTQVAHLPDPVDGEPIGEGYSVYYTEMDYGGVSFAIISDRQFKESPTVAVPDGAVKNGWFTAEGFDIVIDGDVPGVPLLGARQEQFLAEWIEDWPTGTWMKVLMSQTPFACVQTLPAGQRGGNQPRMTIFDSGDYAKNDMPCSDADSNGWPQTGRNRALSILQPAQVLHICGDQHLAFVAQYGIESHRDAGVVFCTPAIANTWPRRWMPRERDATGEPGAPRPFGDHRDGFGNRVSVDAVANPHKRGTEPSALHDRSPGFGMVLFDPSKGTVVLEAWPRAVGLDASIGQYEGWPIVVTPDELTGVSWPYRLKIEDELASAARPGARIEVRRSQDGSLIRIARVLPSSGRGLWRVPSPGTYDVSVFDSEGGQMGLFQLDAEPTTQPGVEP